MVITDFSTNLPAVYYQIYIIIAHYILLSCWMLTVVFSAFKSLLLSVQMHFIVVSYILLLRLIHIFFLYVSTGVYMFA